MKTLKYRLMAFFFLGLTAHVWGDDEAPIKLAPGEKATVTKRTVTIIKVPDTPSDRPSWRCKNVPDDAILQLSHTTGSAADWDKRAGAFMATYGNNCPSYDALEKELPPWLNQKKYTKVLQVLFDLNKVTKPEGLVRTAREDEVESHLTLLTRNTAIKKDQKKLEAFQEKHRELLRRANAARILLELKFPEELKTRYEASHVVDLFMKDYLDKRGNVKSENIPNLKKTLRELNPQQRLLVKGYLREVLAHTEYPKSNLLPSKWEENLQEKGSRSPASLSKKEGKRAAIQVMLFELE